ncbi:MAG: 4Fe-4S binding protein [Chloroflexi bacterium]|nr:4Fe-4S binding protein [Chloroflexota bacterium]
MFNCLKGMLVTLVSTMHGLRQPVTRQYPDSGNLLGHHPEPTPVKDRFMGFPALTWDEDVQEPFCTSCMVCIRQCPTQCMSSVMKDNPLHEEGKSSRRKIVDSFEINLNRCILCGICVEVCNFDAIVMTHEHEMSDFSRNAIRVDLPILLENGLKFQKETGWIPPTQRAKVQKGGDAAAETTAAGTET